MEPLPDPPAILGEPGRHYWSILHESFGRFGSEDEPLVMALCTQVDRLAQIRAAIAVQGVVVTDRFGSLVPNKLLAEERATSLAAGRLWRELGLGSVESSDPARMPAERGYR